MQLRYSQDELKILSKHQLEMLLDNNHKEQCSTTDEMYTCLLSLDRNRDKHIEMHINEIKEALQRHYGKNMTTCPLVKIFENYIVQLLYRIYDNDQTLKIIDFNDIPKNWYMYSCHWEVLSAVYSCLLINNTVRHLCVTKSYQDGTDCKSNSYLTSNGWV